MTRTRLIALVALVFVASGAIAFSERVPSLGYDPDDRLYNREYWAGELQEHGVAAYGTFVQTNEPIQNPDTQHLAAHVFGEVMYEELGLTGVKACDTAYSFGCYHGFLGKAIASEGLSIVTELDLACVSSPDRVSACEHGLGHGILEYLGHAHLIEALKACATYAPINPDTGCTSGVFMEYNVPLTIGNGGLVTTARPLEDPERPYDPCPSLDPKFQTVCYMNLPQWWYQVYAYDFAPIAKLCAAVADTKLQIACAAGLGSIAPSSESFDAGKTRAVCDLLPVTPRDVCLRHAAGALKAIGKIDAARLMCNAATDSKLHDCF